MINLYAVKFIHYVGGYEDINKYQISQESTPF